jgi:hypothetical protein
MATLFDADDTAADLQRLRMIASAARLLVSNVGDRAICSSPACSAEIWWIIHRNGKRTPYNADATNHFLTCPAAKEFKRR